RNSVRRWTNLALLCLIAAAFLTGWLAFSYAAAPARWSLVIHAASGVAILALTPWKSLIIRGGLRHRRQGWWTSLIFTVLVLVSMPGAIGCFTGSSGVSSYQPDAMPVTQWMFDSVPTIAASTWRLRVDGASQEREWTYAQLSAFDDRVTATLDCTGGFYSKQEWTGVWLSRLVPVTDQPVSVHVRSATGYDRRFA